MPLPNFLCVGAQKAGTTTLYQVLKQHPDIYLPDVKEPHFFDEHFHKGKLWYEENFFAQWKKEKAIGEITPAYLYIDEVPGRILSLLGKDIKLIFIYRNPAERAYSHFLMSKFNGFEKSSFQAVMKESELENSLLGLDGKRRFSYKNRGFYGHQTNEFLKIFPKENMLFLLFEELTAADKTPVYDKIFRFLEVDFLPLDFNVKSNAAKKVRNPLIQKLLTNTPWLSKFTKSILPNAGKRKALRKTIKKINQTPFENKSQKLSPELKQTITNDYYLEDIKLLESIIQKELSNWYNVPQ